MEGEDIFSFDEMEGEDIVIIGGGICGLATALALHRKGIKSVILEKSKTLREGGVVISILTNGWRALDQLGIASKLRPVSFPVLGFHDIVLDDGSERRTIPTSKEEIRSFRRMHLMETLAKELPEGTIRFGCQVSAITQDHETSYPIIHLDGGNTMICKVVIGCDGAFSRVAEYVGLKPVKHYNLFVIRGLTNYPSGHNISEKLFTRTRKANVMVGRIPLGDDLVYWFVATNSPSQVSSTLQNSDMKALAKEATKDFPSETISMIDNCDLNSLHFNNLHYRHPCHLLTEKFYKGNVLVAGDAMHVMAPNLGQGGSAALEDAVVLARCLSQKKCVGSQKLDWGKIVLAFEEFVKERRSRVWWLSLYTHLIASLSEHASSKCIRFICIFLIIALFRKPLWDAQYDCGAL